MLEQLEQLNNWLERPVYGEGVLLYQRQIGPGFMLDMLKGGEDDYNRTHLIDTLRSRRDELQAEADAKEAEYPDSLKTELDTGGLLMDERTILKALMREKYNSGITEDAELCEKAFRILVIGDQLNDIYGRRNFFNQHGYLPEAEVIDAEQTPAQLLTRRNTLRTYVSKHTRELKTTVIDSDDWKTIQARLVRYTNELYDVQQRLDAMLTHVPLQHE